MKRALITGAGSYIGFKLTERLAADGVEVHVIVRPQSDLSRLPRCISDNHRHCHDGTTEQMADIVGHANPDTAFHCAGLYLREPKPSDIVSLMTSNYIFGIQLLEALRRLTATANVIYAGTYSQYYMSATPRPLNLYSAAKQAFADALSLYADLYGFRTIQLVLFDNFGSDDWRPKLLKAMVDAVRSGKELPLPDEDVTIDIMHIDDVVSAFLSAANLLETDPKAVSSKTFSVSYGKRYRLSELVALFEQVSGRRIVTRPGGYRLPERRISNPWTGPTLPGWTPKVAIDDAFLDYYRIHG